MSVVLDNAGHSATRDISVEHNRQLGQIISQLKTREHAMLAKNHRRQPAEPGTAHNDGSPARRNCGAARSDLYAL